MEFSSPCAGIAAALIAIQVELEDPGKTRKVDAGAKKYSYAELDKCLPDIRDLCNKHGVYVGQSSAEGDMVTTLLHTSGEWAKSRCPITIPAKTGDPQAFGSSITYARRYSLFMALGLVAQNEDNDGKQPESKDRRRESPDAKAARQADHHESWTPEVQKRFMGDLKKAGSFQYDEVVEYLQWVGKQTKKKAKKPSEMDDAGRATVLKHLKSAEGGENYAKFLDSKNDDNRAAGDDAAAQDADQDDPRQWGG